MPTVASTAARVPGRLLVVCAFVFVALVGSSQLSPVLCSKSSDETTSTALLTSEGGVAEETDGQSRAELPPTKEQEEATKTEKTLVKKEEEIAPATTKKPAKGHHKSAQPSKSPKSEGAGSSSKAPPSDKSGDKADDGDNQEGASSLTIADIDKAEQELKRRRAAKNQSRWADLMGSRAVYPKTAAARWSRT